MTYLERYKSGEFEAVWAELSDLNLQDSSEDDRRVVLEVARETMRRARHNLDGLLSALEEINYVFGAFAKDGFNPQLPRRELAPQEIKAITEYAAEVNCYLPYSFQAWLEEVGCVDLRGKHPTWTADYSDALVVETYLEDFQYEHEAWLEQREAYEDVGVFALPFAPDFYHKEYVSGGPPYALELDALAADARVVDAPYAGSFVDYLRLCFAHAGFPGFTTMPLELKTYLTRGFIPF